MLRRLLVVIVVVLGFAGSARADDPGAPFRAKLAMNMVVAKKAASSLATIAKQTPPKGLNADQRRAWDDQSKALAGAATRFSQLKARMDVVLAKGQNAPPSELAQVNLELVSVQQETEQSSGRFDAVSTPAHARHVAVVKAIH